MVSIHPVLKNNQTSGQEPAIRGKPNEPTGTVLPPSHQKGDWVHQLGKWHQRKRDRNSFCKATLDKWYLDSMSIQLWFMVDITIVNGVYKPTYNWGHHPVYIYIYIYICVCIHIPLWIQILPEKIFLSTPSHQSYFPKKLRLDPQGIKVWTFQEGSSLSNQWI